MQPFDYASAYIAALAGPDAIVDWRVIHDTNKGVPAHNLRGTLAQHWQTLCSYNAAGYGVFVCINEMDGIGRELSNVAKVRTHVIDLDNPASMAADYARAVSTQPVPQFAVYTSPGKAHVYWLSTPYRDNARFETIERKLVALYNSDTAVIDAARVLRVPGFYHRKGEPHLVTCQALAGFGQAIPPEVLEYALAGVQVHVGGAERTELGDAKLAAPSFIEAAQALNAIDPNELDRSEWIAITSAFKQAAWTHAPPEMVRSVWDAWCARYDENDPRENDKQYRSIRNTEVGWKYLARKDPNTHARTLFAAPGVPVPPAPPPPVPTYNPTTPGEPPPRPVEPAVPPVPTDRLLTPEQCKAYFHGCVFVSELGEILTPSGRLMNATKFNGHYGGRRFIVDYEGKVSDDPWNAAIRSTEWRVPIVDHLRFVPVKQPGEILEDALGRTGINTYRPARIVVKQGDPSPFLRHMAMLLPVQSDVDIYLDYLAHNVRFPGHKIPWAPLVQSAEGAGKGMIKRLMQYSMGGVYVYFPNASELVESGGKFNGWMRSKLFILVDEIKVDERRDMIEVLKPLITETEIEVQSKGVDQKKEDNYANWAFFSNYKTAIPIDNNARRFSIFYSPIQSEADLVARGMDKPYFDRLYAWLESGDGAAIITDYLMRRPVERGSLAGRAPKTSSTMEAIDKSRGPIEQAIMDAVADGAPGFRGGWVSTLALTRLLRSLGNRAASKTISGVLEGVGYVCKGRATRAYMQESAESRTMLYANVPSLRVEDFGRAQGYE